MAVKTVRICDICTGGETPAVETIRWRHNGKGYEAEVCERHREERRNLDLALEHWDANGRLLSGTKPRQRSDKITEENRRIRAWANQNGYTLGERGGPIGATIREAYRRAHEPVAPQAVSAI